MIIETLSYNGQVWEKEKNNNLDDADILFLFGEREALKKSEIFHQLTRLYPTARIVGSSSSGNILDDCLREEHVVATAVKFDSAKVEVAFEDFSKGDDIVAMGEKLIQKLPTENLKHIFILSEGLHINGSALANGLNRIIDSKVPITGGLAGDGTDFSETLIVIDCEAKANRIAAIGFYGENIQVENGCHAGWDEFGILRKITKSVDNILYEIDGEPALKLYKKYLGENAKNLPSSALDFPISIKHNKHDTAIIRTILGIDEENQSLIFAGDVPQGCYARLMKTNIDGLIHGAELAAQQIHPINHHQALGLVVSCVGRQLVLKQLTDEELERIQETVGNHVQLVGFYSFGELAPFSKEQPICHLHNQTMTLTVIYEN